MSQIDVIGNDEDDFYYQANFVSPNLEKSDPVPEGLDSAILARLEQSEGNGKRRVVETLYKVVSENMIRPDAIVLRLWRLWGPPQIDKGDILVRCEYDPSTYQVDANEISAAYRILDCHYLNNHSSIARVQPVDKRALTSGTSGIENTKRDFPVPTISKSLQALLETLGSGGTLLLSVRVERGKETVDPQHFILARLAGLPLVAFGRGPLPEEGSIWGVVEQVTPEGLVEISMEYRVITRWPTSPERGWKAELENTSKARKIFSLVDHSRAS